MNTRALRFWLCSLSFLVLLPFSLFGDGVIISPTAFAEINIPDQQALVHYANGQERLVIETSFIGTGTNFAWVVPVPARPEIEAVSPGFFTTLQFVLQPRLYHNVPNIWGLILSLGALVYLFITVRPTGSLTASDLIACLCIAGGMGIAFTSPALGILLLLTLVGVASARRSGGLLVNLLLTVLVALFLSALLLPSLASAKASGSSVSQVIVLDRKNVGSYDTATLASKDGTALTDWLSAHGFPVSTNLAPVIREYAREGWIFVALRIIRDRDTSSATAPHPLAFTFKTDKPVYPMRLTGAGHKTCRVTLYVLGTERANTPGYSVERCNQLRETVSQDDDQVVIQHPEILKLMPTAPIITKLTANLKREEMQNDVYISWEPFQRKQQFQFSYHGAVIMAVNVTMVLLALGVTYLAINRRFQLRFQPRIITVLLIAILAGVITYCVLPKTPVSLTRMPRMYVSMFHKSAVHNLCRSEREAPKQLPGIILLETYRSRMKDFVKPIPMDDRFRINPYSGLPYQEEDSPGNYILRMGKFGPEYVWYNEYGKETIQALDKFKE